MSSTTTDGSGNYSLGVPAAGTYSVRVVSSSVTSSRTGYVSTLRPVLTFRKNALTGTAVDVTDHVGGHDPATADAGDAAAGWILNATTGVFSGSGSGKAHAFAPVTFGATAVTGVDFGWNFDTVANTNNTGQGSLRQFITNANTLGGDASLVQSGLVAARENAVFMISNGTAAAGLRATNNYFSGGVATIRPTSALPTINRTVVIDGTTQTVNGGDTNPGVLGTGGLVGVDGLALSQVARPEITLVDGANITNGFNVTAANVTIRGLAIHGFARDISVGSVAGIPPGKQRSGGLSHQLFRSWGAGSDQRICRVCQRWG